MKLAVPTSRDFVDATGVNTIGTDERPFDPTFKTRTDPL